MLGTTAQAAVFIATAYSWGCGANDLNRLERPPVPFFTVAVDPTIIQLGTALEIDGPFLTRDPVTLWRAEDTGPDIVGNRIDLMVKNCEQAKWWGRREVVVKVRKDLEWQNKLPTQHARLADRLVSIRGSANLRARLSSVSIAEAQAARRSATIRLNADAARTAYGAFRYLADHSSLLAWARLVSR